MEKPTSWGEAFEAARRPEPGVDIEKTPSSQNIRLEGGVPLWHAFLEDPTAAVMDTAEERTARSLAAELFTRDPEAANLCEGKSIEEAKVILGGIQRDA